VNEGGKPRALPLWPLFPLLILLAGLLDGGLELYHQSKYALLEEELDRLLFPIKEVRASFESDGALRINKGGDDGAPFKIEGTGIQDGGHRWLSWNVEAIPNPSGTDKIGFRVELSQERGLLPSRPRIKISPLGSLPPILASYVDDLFQSRSISYERVESEQ